MSDSSISIIIVTWNHRGVLVDCLESLELQNCSDFDVVILDNASMDGTPEWVASRYPEIRLHRFSENQGFSRAFNWGVRHSAGSFVLSLNPDVVATAGFLSAMVDKIAADERVGIVAPKLLRAGNPAILDSTGLFVDRRRRPYDRGQGEADHGQYDDLPWVFGACGAAALYRRTMLDDLASDGAYFDEGFFAYYEDADLAWRAQLRDFRCVYAPAAVATHDRGWGDTLRKKGRAAKNARGPRLALRNRYLMTIKNDAFGYFLADLPRILAAECPRLAYTALTRPRILLGLFDLLRDWPDAMEKRRRNRSRRTVDDAVVRRWFLDPLAASEGR